VGNSVEQLELDEALVIEANPFGGTEARWVAPPVQTALAELIRQIDCRRRLIVVAGKPGTGKTLLADMVVRVCSDMGLLTCRIDRGDLAHVVHSASSDVVVVDEAASITGPTLQTLLPPDGKTATICVFLCLPTAAHRFSCPDTYVIDLHSLSHSDARTYLLEKARSIGHPHLFAPDALHLAIHRARGSFRLLRSIASLAFFDAAHEGETQIAVRHVASALESQMVENADENDIVLRSRISHGDSADEVEADPSQDEPVLNPLETAISHVDQGANLHADVSHSAGADQPVEHLLRRADIRRPMGLAIEPIPDSGMEPSRLSVRMCEQSDRLDTERNRRFPVLGIAITGLLLAGLIYSRDEIVSFAERTFEQVTEEGLAQKAGDALLPKEQTQVAAPDLLLSFPFKAVVAEPVSLRAELLPPIPVIAVTRPVSLRDDLMPAAIRQALIAAAVPVQGGQAQLQPGRRYGLQNRGSRITLRVHRPTIVAIRDARNRVFIDRKLAPGDTYRVPNLVGLWLTAIDASAVEIVLDGASAGFAGAQRATVWDLSLDPQRIASRARGTNSEAGSVAAVQRNRATEEAGVLKDEPLK
jgi:hypothetical protein